jgi:Domain of unknown function (DUF4375)
MPESIGSYWELVKPLFSTIDYGNSPAEFAASITAAPRPCVLLFAAHMCLAETHNGGFLQLFWNTTGMLVPEGAEGFRGMGMPKTATLLEQAALPLGTPYPRDRDQRWDALPVASSRKSRDLKQIFKKAENFYLGFVEATATLGFDALDKRFWETARTENGGFQDAATRYAQSVHLVQ